MTLARAHNRDTVPLSRLPGAVFTIFQGEILEARKSLKVLSTAKFITKYSSERFLSICGEKIYLKAF